MEYMAGIVAGALVGITGTWSGMDRDRAFYATVLIVIATYYVLFAAMQPSLSAMGVEIMVALAFLALAIAGFRRNQWILVGGLLLHALFDRGHDSLVTNPAVPPWWPGFCTAVDALLAAWLAVLLLVRSGPTMTTRR